MSEIDISSELSKTTKNNETEHVLRGGGHWGCRRAVEGPNDPAVLASLAKRHNVGHIVGMIRETVQQDPVPERNHARTWQRIV